jgi:hypothetical protein
MFTTRREAARVDEFLLAIRTSGTGPAHPPTAELPRIVATATPLAAEHDDPALIDRLPWLAIAALFVALFAPLVILLGVDYAPAAPAAPAPAMLDTSEQPLEVGAGRVVR